MEVYNTCNNKKALLFSLVFHGIVITIMFQIHVVMKIERPEFFELVLSGVSQTRVEQILKESRRTETARVMKEKTLSPEERVDMPERKMIEVEEPAISVPAQEKIESKEIVSHAEKIKLEMKSPEHKYDNNANSIFTMDRKETFQGSQITLGEEPGAGLETEKIGSDMNFDIQGEIKGRELISSPLPQYPQGLNKNAVIKIRITVLPDGSVSSTGMVPIRKESAVLENLTMSKLKLWRFSPLDQGDNRTQTGVVTFNYKIK